MSALPGSATATRYGLLGSGFHGLGKVNVPGVWGFVGLGVTVCVAIGAAGS